jgi:hypothetical protein
MLGKWLNRGKLRNRATARRPALAFDFMEARTLMAVGVFAGLEPPHSPPQFHFLPSQNVFVVNVTDRQLLHAVEDFLAQLDAAYGAGGSGTTDTTAATLQSGINQIASLASSASATTIQSLATNVSQIVSDGAITTPQRTEIVTQLNTVLTTSGLLAVLTTAPLPDAVTAGQPAVTTLLDEAIEQNAIDSTPAGQTLGQGPLAAPPASVVSPSGSTLPGSGPLGTGFGRLIDDLKSALGKSQIVTPAQTINLGRDFADVVASSSRPDGDAVATLRQSLNTLDASGLSPASRDALYLNVKNVLTSSSVPSSVLNRTLADLQPVLSAPDVDPTALQSVLGDLANLLSARPRSASPFGGWWLGGAPR